jgi:uncharacterized protein
MAVPVAIAFVVGSTLPASAHVSVSADDPSAAAADSILTFRVPNERDGASTVSVTIAFPKKTPLASIKPAAKQGWTITTKPQKFDPPIKTDDGTITDGIAEVTWTAKDTPSGLAPGTFGAFQVLVGPLPANSTSLSFPTLQGYSNGDVEKWTEPSVDGQAASANQAPRLKLVSAGSAATSANVAAEAAPRGSAEAPAGAASDGSTGTSGTSGLTIAALVLAVFAAGLGGLSLVRNRRRVGPTEPAELSPVD